MKSKIDLIVSFIKKYKTKSILVRNFLCTILISVMIFMIIGAVFYQNVKSTLKQEIADVNNANLSRCAGMMDAMTDEIYSVVAFISMRTEIEIYMLHSQNTEEEKNKVINCIEQFTVTRDYINSVYVYHETNDTVFQKGVVTKRSDFNDTEWYKEYIENNDKYYNPVYLRKKNNKYPYFITIIKMIYDKGTGKKLGAIVCNVDLEKMADIFNREDNISDNFFITDNSGSVIYSRDNKMLDMSIDKEDIEVLKENTKLYDVKNKKMLASMRPQEKYGKWNYGLIIPVAEYDNKIDKLFRVVALVIISCICLCLVMSCFVVIRPFNLIRRIIETFEQYDTYSIYDTKSTNETEYILTRFISAAESNRELQSELINKFNELRREQTIALQTQISPHFIRNTIEIINFRAFKLLHGPNEISNMLCKLGEMTGNFINSKDYIIAIDDELKYTKLYSDILKIHFKDNIVFNYECDPKLYDYQIIKLSLQPIIENAVNHGLKEHGNKGNVWVKIKEEEDVIRINIDDDGAGMSDEEIEMINNNTINEEKTQHGIGICNVQKRYALIFGDEYGLRVKRSKYGGVCVEYVFPKIKM